MTSCKLKPCRGARCLVAALLLLMTAVLAAAQTDTGRLVGKIIDPNGAVVTGANVRVKSVATGREVTTTSDNEGIYNVVGLLPGFYDVTVESGSFQPNTQRVQVTVGSNVTLETKLALTEVAAGTVSVVASEGLAVNTQTPEVSNIVTGTQIRQLPTLTRNPYDLIGLGGNINNDDPGPAVPGVGLTGRGAGFSINGQRASSTNVLLDGVDNNSVFYGSLAQNVPLEAVAEFRVVTSNFSAEYGRASGGIVNVAVLSGSNDFHGSAYEFNRISKLASNGFNNNANGVPRGVFTRNQFGYTIGGPIKSNKLFFFNSTEFTRVRSSGPLLAVVPTQQLIAASAATTQNFFAGRAIQATPTGTIYTVGDVVADNIPVAVQPGNAFAALPANLPAFQQVTYTEPTNLGGGVPQNTYSMVLRVDYNLSDKTLLYGRWARENKDFPLGSTGFSPYTGFDTASLIRGNNFLLTLNHTFSPTLLSETKLSYNKWKNDAPYGAAPIEPGLFMFPGGTGVVRGNAITFPGYWPFNGANSPVGFGGPQNVGQVYENMTFTRGRHQWKFGGSYFYIQDNHLFGAFQTAVESLGVQGNYAQALANFVTGNINQFQAAINPQGKFPGDSVNLPVNQPDFTRSNRYNEWAAYVNDSFRWTPRLVLNLGLRYEYYGVQHNKNPDLDSNFYFGSGSTIQERIKNGSAQLAANSPVGGLWAPDKNNFAPRVGIAYDLFGDGKTSIRAGYGLAYERNFGNVTFNLIQNPPAYLVLSLFNNVDVPNLQITTQNLGPLAGTTPPTKQIPVGSLRYVREDIVNAYAHFFSAGFQRELGAGNILSIEYSGSRGEKLYSIDPLNVPGAAAVFLGDPDPNKRLNTQYANINGRGNLGFSRYNALIVGLDSTNFRHTGVQFTAHYTYSVSKDNLSTAFSEAAFNNNLGLTNPFGPRNLDYGYSDSDVRHRFVGSVIWQIPYAKNMSGFRKALLDGWTVTGIYSARTGNPFTIFDSGASNVNAPRLVPNGPLTVNLQDQGANFFSYIDLAGQPVGAFVNPLCGCSDFGPYPDNMTKRNQFRAPGIWNFDAGLYRTVKLSERYSLQFRGELFNVLNHANLYLVPGTFDVAGSNFVGANRGVTPNGNIERRNVQLAVKFIF